MNAIVFDLDETLINYTKPYEEILADAFTSVKGTVEQEWIDSFTETFDELFSNHEPDPVARAFTETGACSEPEPYVTALQKAETRAQELTEGTREDLEVFSTSFRLGVLTNGPREWQLAKLRTHDLTRYFDAVVTSYDAGAHKPAPEPYLTIEERINAERYTMVGDHERDVNGAQSVGWDAYLYTGGRFSDLLQDAAEE